MSQTKLTDLDYSVLQQCMHCGMCLPSCPTYESTKRERHSPRGRISLMRAVADGELEVGEDLADEMNYCLGCLACTSACPAGVDYTTMFETARAEIESLPSAKKGTRHFFRSLTLGNLFLHPKRLLAVGKLLRFYQQTGLDKVVRALKLPYLAGPSIAALEPQTPRLSPKFSDEIIGEWEHPPEGIEHRGNVGMLTGCVQSIAFADINRDTVDVLLHNGWSVFTPRAQHCCGSIHAHNGAPELAAQTGLSLMAQFGTDWKKLEAIITNAGGCGSHLKHYTGQYPDRTPEKKRAGEWDKKVKDIHEFLVETGFTVPESEPNKSRKLTYHESCHLCHGQGIKQPPRQILAALPDHELVELPASDMCCGSAGIYNLLQPEESDRILSRKIDSIKSTKAPCVVTSNPGCHLQLEKGLREASMDVTVAQPVSLLAEAYRKHLR